jgi:hypothetical protein
MMNCKEFELRGLDLDRADADPREGQAAAEHAEVCARCSALLESWRDVKIDLHLLRDTTRLDSAPARVEMRLKQELQTRREARIPQHRIVVASWALAGAAVLIASIGWVRTRTKVPVSGENAARQTNVSSNISAGAESGALRAADHDAGEFTQLPGSLPSGSGDEAILQVRMERGALGRFGLPVEPDRASEWVNVDFLVGEDGQPQAVRLHQNDQVAVVTQ